LDLGPAGEARAHPVTKIVERNLAGELLNVSRLLGAGADDREIAAHDVDDLRELVQVRSPQEMTEGRHSWVALSRPLSHEAAAGGAHGAELEDLERPAVLPDARLAVEERPPVAREVREPHQREDEDERQRPH